MVTASSVLFSSAGGSRGVFLREGGSGDCEAECGEACSGEFDETHLTLPTRRAAERR